MTETAPRPRTLLLIAALLAAVSLGLPWGTNGPSQPGTWVGSYYNPSWCTTAYDIDGWAYLDCTPSSYNPGIYVSGNEDGVRSGYAHSSRVFIVAAALLVAGGLRQRSEHALKAGLVVAAVGAVCDGIGTASGFYTYLAAVAALAFALEPLGVIRIPRRRSMAATAAAPRTI